MPLAIKSTRLVQAWVQCYVSIMNLGQIPNLHFLFVYTCHLAPSYSEKVRIWVHNCNQSNFSQT